MTSFNYKPTTFNLELETSQCPSNLTHSKLQFKLISTKIRSGVAQSAERVAVNHWVGGSNPSAGALIEIEQTIAGLLFYLIAFLRLEPKALETFLLFYNLVVAPEELFH